MHENNALIAKRGVDNALFSARAPQSFSRCECGDLLPGTCPGVGNCPYATPAVRHEEPDPDRLLEDRRERRRIDREQGA